MQANRSRDTKPELRLRSLLHRKGLRYRVSYKPLKDLRWTADVVFTRARVAVFMDGCYWHGCPLHYKEPSRNSFYWRTKIEGNRKRDSEFDRLLVEAGWRVVRRWEHEDVTNLANEIERLVSSANRSMNPAASGF